MARWRPVEVGLAGARQDVASAQTSKVSTIGTMLALLREAWNLDVELSYPMMTASMMRKALWMVNPPSCDL